MCMLDFADERKTTDHLHPVDFQIKRLISYTKKKTGKNNNCNNSRNTRC